jgi:hypothetical protein
MVSNERYRERLTITGFNIDRHSRLAVNGVAHEFEGPALASSTEIEHSLNSLTHSRPIVLLDCGSHPLLEFLLFS